MVKYALILAFSYPKILDATYDIQSLTSCMSDICMITDLCRNIGIEKRNITIITDLTRKIRSDIYECNIRINSYPSDIFVCREICQFIENTIRGIEDSSYKGDNDNPEVLLYISGHGEKINIDGKNNQGITLTSEDGKNLKYLLSKDLFNIIFGNFMIDSEARMSVPIYSKIKIQRRVENETKKMLVIETIGVEEHILFQLSPTIASPQSSPDMLRPYRSSYMTNRGLPVSSKLLTIVDTCYSEHMTYFPFIYESRTDNMIPTSNFNIDIGIDLPYCVTISSCESNKTSQFSTSGSSLTKILFMQLCEFKGKLSLSQLNYLIYNSSNRIINELIRNECTHPIITSTINSSEIDIPFFNILQVKKMVIIDK